MKKVLLTILLAIVLLTQVGCQKKKLVANYDLGGEPRNLDPQTAKDIESITVIQNIFEGLVKLDENGEIKPACAKSFKVSDDGLVYSFQLDEDAVWQNGTHVIAADFAFAINRILDKTTNSPFYEKYFIIKNAKSVYENSVARENLGVKVLSDYSLQIELEYPSISFLTLLSDSSSMPCQEEFFYQTKGEYGLEKNTILSNSRYSLFSWKHMKLLKLAKNDKYHALNPKGIDVVNLYLDKDADKTSRFIDKKTDATFALPSEIEKVQKKGNNVQNSTWGISFNNKNKQLANVNIRKGIAKAVDKTSYDKRLPEFMTVANSVISPGAMIGKKHYLELAQPDPAYAYDPKTAKDYFDLGLSQLDGKPLDNVSIMIVEFDYIDHNDLFTYISQILQRDLNLYIKVDKVTPAQYEKRLKTGDFDCVINKLSMKNNNPATMFDEFKTDSLFNVFGYSSSALDMSLTAFDKSSSEEEMFQAITTANNDILSNAQFVPLYYDSDYFVISSDFVSNISYNSLNGIVSFN
ncbi:MAG: peptide ABC transporter substrate-binding protein [Oscillospiraceae bacterium]